MAMTYTRYISTDFFAGVRVDVLHAEIQASAITEDVIQVSSDETMDICWIEFEAPLSQADEDILAAVIAAHSGVETLQELKDRRCTELSQQARAFIQREDYYPLERQVTLTKIQEDARRLENQTCVDYIQAGWNWAFAVMGHYFAKEAEIQALGTAELVNAAALDLDQFLPHTRVQIATAIGMLQ